MYVRIGQVYKESAQQSKILSLGTLTRSFTSHPFLPYLDVQGACMPIVYVPMHIVMGMTVGRAGLSAVAQQRHCEPSKDLVSQARAL